MEIYLRPDWRQALCQRLFISLRLKEAHKGRKLATIGALPLVSPVHNGENAVITGRDISHIIHIVIHTPIAYPGGYMELVCRRFRKENARFQELVVIHETRKIAFYPHLSLFVVEEAFKR